MKDIKSKHYVGTAIYSVDTIIRTLKQELKQQFDKLNLGITSEQFVVLDTIYCYENIYQERLSSILMKDKSNTTRILKILESKNLITKTAKKINNRLVYCLNITDEGKKLTDETMPEIKKYITSVFKSVTDEETEVLYSLSKKFRNDLSKNNDTTT